ncbi:WD repeat-containing protein 7 [Elysia marginata]|uniref:WD repeat-containing protein 7 n=1 Tax=Elysia marginata TaxID=1093978 RepID=A0AAV4J1S6_9GAST|nr:WD repeat-containing protein 7 [Elysia marginata]
MCMIRSTAAEASCVLQFNKLARSMQTLPKPAAIMSYHEECDETWNLPDERDLSVSANGVVFERTSGKQGEAKEPDIDSYLPGFVPEGGLRNSTAPFGRDRAVGLRSQSSSKPKSYNSQLKRSYSVPTQKYAPPPPSSLVHQKYVLASRELFRGSSVPHGDVDIKVLKVKNFSVSDRTLSGRSEKPFLGSRSQADGQQPQRWRKFSREPEHDHRLFGQSSMTGSQNRLLAKAKEKAETVGYKIQSKVDALNNPSMAAGSAAGGPGQTAIETQPSGSGKKKPDSIPVHESLSMAIGELFMSCLHAWDLDPTLDELCINKLGLHRPRCPVSFGLLSHGGHMSLMLPGWHRHHQGSNAAAASAGAAPLPLQVKESSATQGSPSKSKDGKSTASAENSSLVVNDFSTKLRWQISSAVTTQHLLSVISVANTLMGMTRAVFLKGPVPVQVEEQAMAQAQVKQGWSLLAALHCVLLPELVGPSHYQHPQLEMLARRWQDRCLEIREAAQALLLAELRRINPEGRKRLLDQWAPFLPSYVDPELSLLSNTGGGAGHASGGDIPAHKLSVSFESRRKQATAIVMLGVIGAEFGHEMEPSRSKSEEGKRTANGGKGTVEGFSLTNYSLSRHTSKALTFLLLQPPSPRLPLHTPIRRAAIDLIGRGFTVWEPYLDVSSVLLGLLELSIDAHKLIPRLGNRFRSRHAFTTYGLPLSPAADACRSARHALSLIATARPPAFVITMAKEVARYNALAQTAQHQHAHLHGTVLARASAEILHVIELLVEKIPNDVADLIVEAMDVTMFCLDLATLKAKGLPELFPAICRFSMVAYCHQTKRVWVGARNGMLALYELKQHSRCQMVPAHNGPITAVAVNQDGKYVATFSHVDNKLRFWQTASTSLFGIGSQGTKMVKTYSTPAIALNPVTNILKLVRLVWVDKYAVVLLTVDGKELKFSI